MKLIILLFTLVIGFNYALQDAVKNIWYPKESNLYVVHTKPTPTVTLANKAPQDAIKKSDKNGLEI